MKKKMILTFSLILVLGLLLTACNTDESANTNDDLNNTISEISEEKLNETSKKHLIIGTSQIMAKVVESAVSSLESRGYEIEVKIFDDFVLPNVALEEESIDANLFQHKPYLDEYNKNNNTNFKMVDQVVLSLVGFYSNKYDSADSLPEGSKIGIFQDTSNQDRALRMLDELELITLKEKEGLYTLLDVEDNVKKLEFFPMDINQLVKGLVDLDASFVTGPNIVLSEVSPKYTISVEKASDETIIYAAGLVVNEENMDEQWTKDILEAFKTQETEGALFEVYKGTFQVVVE